MRSILCALTVSLLLIVACDAGEIPEAWRDYVKNLSETIEVKELYIPAGAPAVPETITRSQALEDIEMLAYLFQNGYSGREFYEMRGMDFQEIYQGLREAVEQFDEPIRVLDFENRIAESFSEIFDGHLGINGHRGHRFYRHQDVYCADILVEERDGAFVVVQAAVSGVQVGDELTEDDPKPFLFKTLSPEGRKHYLMGSLSDTYCPQQTVSFNHKEVCVPLHASRMSQATKRRDTCTLTQIDGVDVLNVQRFPRSPMTPLRAQPYVEAAQTLKERPAFILDLRNNPGGSSEYARVFFQTLNRVAHWRMASAVLRSPVTQAGTGAAAWAQGLSKLWKGGGDSEGVDKTGTRTWRLYPTIRAQQTGDYPGQVIVLMDRKVASSGEAAVAYSKSVKDSIRVGENTGGIGTFGDIRRYFLPHSKLRIHLPHKLFVTAESLEGRGYLPDFWLDTAQPVQEIIRWLKDPQSYHVTFPEPAVLRDMDFEQWNDETPMYVSKQVGATNNRQGKHAQIVRDTDTKAQGQASVRFSGDAQTGIWYCLQQKVPHGAGVLRVRYAVKGRNLKREANQFNSCYVGFIYKDPTGRRKFHIQSYRDTFDWKEDEVTLDCKDKFEIVFTIFSNISGDFWVDDVRFDQE